MIHAWFETSGEEIIPALVPDGDILDLAQTVGMSERDLFKIELPSGATRPGRVTVLVAQDTLDALYRSASDGANPSALFKWRETSNAPLSTMAVWLRAPRPLYMVADGAGVAVVEAVDARWWWSQAQVDLFSATPFRGNVQSSDGRWKVVDCGFATPRLLMAHLVASIATAGLPGTIVIPAGYTPDASLLDRISDHLFTPECSLAMAIDLLAAGTGWMVQWDCDANALTLKAVGDDVANLDTWMKTRRAFVAGLTAPGNAAVPTEPLLGLWYGDSRMFRNELPDSVNVSFPYRTVEGKTRYGNTTTDTTTLMFASEREFGWEQPLAAGRGKATIGVRTLKESRPLVASAAPALTPATPTSAILGTTAPSWDYATYRTQVGTLLETRASVMFGKVGWMGWPKVPMGSYRCTMLRYGLARRDGAIVPLTVTDCETTDWLLGPDGMMASDPKDIVLSKGMAHARKLWSGTTMIDSAPPNTRVFPARILWADQICGGWKWIYGFEEVEPNPTVNCPMYVSIEPFARTGTARNLMENGNDPTAGIIMPGVLQADYPLATINPIPIAVGAIVDMVEQFPTAYTTGTPPPHPPQYWFSVPNAVKVECEEL
jgi:hypothetical protein